MPKRFDDLTAKQEDVLGLIAMGCDHGHHPATVKSLIKRGLVIEHEVILPDPRFPIRMKVYEMPLYHHMRWCQWCADNSPLPDEQ